MSKYKEYLVSAYRAGQCEALIGIRTKTKKSAMECALAALGNKKELGIVRVVVESFDVSTLKTEWASYE